MNKDIDLAWVFDYLYDFLNKQPFESTWYDTNGKAHTADLGYVCEFLLDFRDHLNKIGGFSEFTRRTSNMEDENEE